MSLIEKEQDDERDRRASAEVWREVTSTAVARQDAPRDRDNGVLITTSSHFSASQSVAASSAASSGFGQAFLEGANVSLGLKKLNRPEWNIEVRQGLRGTTPTPPKINRSKRRVPAAAVAFSPGGLPPARIDTTVCLARLLGPLFPAARPAALATVRKGGGIFPRRRTGSPRLPTCRPSQRRGQRPAGPAAPASPQRIHPKRCASHQTTPGGPQRPRSRIPAAPALAARRMSTTTCGGRGLRALATKVPFTQRRSDGPLPMPQEITRREQVLPILKKTVGQIDGTIKPKFSQFAKNTSKAQNLEEFGMQFYEVLFARLDIWRGRREGLLRNMTDVGAAAAGAVSHVPRTQDNSV